MMNQRSLLALLAALLTQVACSTTDTQDPAPELDTFNDKDLVFNHEGVERTYRIYLPGNLPDNAPVLFALHGLGGKSESMYRNNATRKETLQATTNATLHKYLPEGEGVEVHYYRIENYGHEWPGSANKVKPGEQDASGFRATEVIWEFFSRY